MTINILHFVGCSVIVGHYDILPCAASLKSLQGLGSTIIYCYIENKNIFLWYLLAKIIGCHFPNLRAIAQDVLSKAH